MAIDPYLTSLQWNDGRRGQDGWDRYTRRRKWCRDAELVEIPQGPENTSAATKSSLTQALDNERESGNVDASTVDTDAVSLAPSASSKARKRRWFGSTKPVSDKASSTSSALPVSTNTSPVDAGKITSTTSYSPSPTPGSRPIDMAQSRKPSNYSGNASYGSRDRDSSVSRSISHSDSVSIRDKEIVHAQDRLDRWATRATGGIERAERELGLGDEVNMGLS